MARRATRTRRATSQPSRPVGQLQQEAGRAVGIGQHVGTPAEAARRLSDPVASCGHRGRLRLARHSGRFRLSVIAAVCVWSVIPTGIA